MNILLTTLLQFYPVNLQTSSFVHVCAIRVKNCVDPVQVASSGSTVSPKRKKSGFNMTWVKPSTRACKFYASNFKPSDDLSYNCDYCIFGNNIR